MAPGEHDDPRANDDLCSIGEAVWKAPELKISSQIKRTTTYYTMPGAFEEVRSSCVGTLSVEIGGNHGHKGPPTYLGL